MNLGLIREHISKSLLNNDTNKVKSFINTIKNDKNILEELSVYGLIESLSENTNVNLIIESLDKYDNRTIKIKELFNNFHNKKYVISEDMGKLYNAISILIENKYKKQSAKKLVESYEVINNYIKQNNNNNNVVMESKNDSVITGDYKKLFPYITKNIIESYKDLNENDNKVINVIINGSNEDKRFMFEEIKQRSLDMIENLSEDDMDIEMKEQTLDKINEMDCDCDENKIEENILTLHELLDNDDRSED
jgi:hypothetical protein